MAVEIVDNGKTQRPSVCNALETVLVHRDVATEFLPMMKARLDLHNVELRGCERTCQILRSIKRASEEDWATEYNDFILAVKIVDSLDEAIAHIAAYSTGHSDGIVTNDLAASRRFTAEVDSAAVYVNASTRFYRRRRVRPRRGDRHFHAKAPCKRPDGTLRSDLNQIYRNRGRPDPLLSGGIAPMFQILQDAPFWQPGGSRKENA